MAWYRGLLLSNSTDTLIVMGFKMDLKVTLANVFTTSLSLSLFSGMPLDGVLPCQQCVARVYGHWFFSRLS